MKKKKILILFPVLGLFLTGCTFQEGFGTVKGWIGDHIYNPIKNLITGGGKEEKQDEGGDEEGGGEEEQTKTYVEIVSVDAPKEIKVNETLSPSDVKLVVKYTQGSTEGTENVKAQTVELDTSSVGDAVKGKAFFKGLEKEFTIKVYKDADPAPDPITPEEVIALCDKAGSGVVVSSLIRVTGVVADGSVLIENTGWKGSFVSSGQKALVFDSVRTSEEYKSLDGATVVIEGYAELYDGSYKVGYLPEKVSPTGKKYNPTLISAQLPAQKEVSEVINAVGPTKVLVGDTVGIRDVTLNVRYSDGTEGTEIPDTVTLDTSVANDSAQLSWTLGEHSGTFVVKVVAVKSSYTPEEVIALCDEAGSGNVVAAEINISGVVAEGSSKGQYGWEGKFVVTSGEKELTFGSLKTETEYESLDGATIVIKGYAELYNGVYKVAYLPPSASPTGAAYNPTLVSAEFPEVKAIQSLVADSAVGIPASIDQYESLNKNAITVSVVYEDGTPGEEHPKSIELVTSVAGENIAGKLVFGDSEALKYPFTITVNSVEALPGTVGNPYTVAQAREAATATAVPDTYVTGIIYKIDSFNSKYGSLTYWISDNGSGDSSNKDGLQIYSGLNIGGVKFTGVDDLSVGDQVVVKGSLKIYTPSGGGASTYELDFNNEIVSRVVPTVESVVISGTPSQTEYGVGQDYSHAGLIATATLSNGLEVDVTEKATWTPNKTTAEEGDVSISFVAEYEVASAPFAFPVTISSSAVPVETQVYKLDGTITATGNAYATATTLTQSGVEWDVVGNTEMNPWRIGGKGLTNENRSVKSNGVVSTDDISKVAVDVGATGSGLTVNSITLNVGNAAGDSDVYTETKTSNLTGTVLEFEKPSAADWSSKYFTVVFNVTRTSTSGNGYVQLNAIVFYAMK